MSLDDIDKNGTALGRLWSPAESGECFLMLGARFDYVTVLVPIGRVSE